MGKIKANLTNWLASDQGKNVLTALIIILVGFASFGLGRLSRSGESAGIVIEYTEPEPPASGNVLGAEASAPKVETVQPAPKPSPKPVAKASTIKTYFASSRGNKYYHLGCSCGKNLKEENKIYFT